MHACIGMRARAHASKHVCACSCAHPCLCVPTHTRTTTHVNASEHMQAYMHIRSKARECPWRWCPLQGQPQQRECTYMCILNMLNARSWMLNNSIRISYEIPRLEEYGHCNFCFVLCTHQDGNPRMIHSQNLLLVLMNERNSFLALFGCLRMYDSSITAQAARTMPMQIPIISCRSL